MQAIVTEALLSDAIFNRMNQASSPTTRQNLDSIDIYEPILSKFDYTIGDFRYTVGEMAMRKSNPLDNIFKNVAADIEERDAIASLRYRQIMKYDTLARNFYADTIFCKDTTIIGSLSKFKIEIIPARRGSYQFEFKYTAQNSQVVSKSLKHEAVGAAISKNVATYWLSQNDSLMPFKAEFKLPETYDTLTFKFTEIKGTKNLTKTKDTSEIRSLRIIWYPYTEDARKNYYYQTTGFVPSIKEDYEQRFPYLSDSITIPFKHGVRPTEKRTFRVLFGRDITRRPL